MCAGDVLGNCFFVTVNYFSKITLLFHLTVWSEVTKGMHAWCTKRVGLIEGAKVVSGDTVQRSNKQGCCPKDALLLFLLTTIFVSSV